MVLGALGGLAGLVLGAWALRLIETLMPPALAAPGTTGLDRPVLAFAGLVALAATALVAVAPVLGLTGGRLLTTTRTPGDEARGLLRHGRPVLVVGEVALAVVLLAAAGLLIRSFAAIIMTPTGFVTRGVLTAQVYRAELPARPSPIRAYISSGSARSPVRWRRGPDWGRCSCGLTVRREGSQMTGPKPWLVTLVCGVIAMSGSLPLRARDQKDTGASGTSITGRVVDADSQQPIEDAEVQLGPPPVVPGVAGMPSAGSGRIGRLPSVLTGPDGRFAFANVAAGSYSPHAQKAGYLWGSYGESRQTGSPLRLDVLSGKTVDITIQLRRQAALSGVVRTPAGQPLPGKKVMALLIVPPESGRGGLWVMSLSAVSDDRGAYRIATLLPGRYLACVVLDPKGVMSFGGGRAMATQVRDPEECSIFSPNASLPTEATAISLAGGDEGVADIDVPDASRGVSVSGRVEGLPEVYRGTQVRLVLANGSPDIPAGFQVGAVPLQGDASFVFSGVAPGVYFVRGLSIAPRISSPPAGLNLTEHPWGGAGLLWPDGRTPIAPLPTQRVLWFEQRIEVETRALHDVMAHAIPGATVSGRIALDPQLTLSGTSLEAIAVEAEHPLGTGWNLDGVPMGRLEADGTFASVALPPGQYEMGLHDHWPPDQGDWYVESAMLGGRDVRYEGFDISGADITNVVLTLTSQRALVTGLLRDSDGRPRPDASIFVFPAEERNWPFGYDQEFRTDPSGAFSIPFPAGTWILAAAVGRIPEFCCDHDFLRTLAPRGTQVSLARGEHKTVALTVQVIPPR